MLKNVEDELRKKEQYEKQYENDQKWLVERTMQYLADVGLI